MNRMTKRGATAAINPTVVAPSLDGCSTVWQRFVRTIFVQTKDTPNPESVQFIPGDGDDVQILAEDSNVDGWYVTAKDDRSEILRSPLARELFNVEGVKAVYLAPRYVTVTKYAERKWRELQPQIFDRIIAWVDSGQPALSDEPIITDTTILDDDTEVVAMIKEIIEQRIRPAVQEDGGDIRYVGFEEETGIATVQLAGSCVGCPSSSVTLKQGVENMLMHYIPDVKEVVEEEEEPHDEDEASSGQEQAPKQQKTYEERLKAAGIPFSD